MKRLVVNPISSPHPVHIFYFPLLVFFGAPKFLALSRDTAKDFSLSAKLQRNSERYEIFITDTLNSAEFS